MSRFKNLNKTSCGKAKWQREQRHLRKQMGKEAYKEMTSEREDRFARIYISLIILVFMLLAFGTMWMGY